MIRKLIGEWFGCFFLVFFGCGCTALAGATIRPELAAIYQAVAFGLAYTVLFQILRPVSSAHFNPAVTIGFAIANRFPVRDLVPYIAAQVTGAAAGAVVLYAIASGRTHLPIHTSLLGPNGYGEHSPGNYPVQSALIVEALATFVFVLVNLSVTRLRASRLGGAALIGLSMTLCSLIAVPVTNASLNPARSTGIALIVGGWALDELWLFWAAPLAGGLLAGIAYPLLIRAKPRIQRPGTDRAFGEQAS